MAGWNGSGTYSRYHDWTTDEAGAVAIDATRMDQEDDAIAAGINACLTKNGENAPSANLPMGNYKHTGVGAGTARTHYADVASVQDSTYHYGATSGTDTYTVTLAPAITAYATGQRFIIKVGIANTGAATINLNGIGAKSLVKGVSTALVAGDLLANKFYSIVYDGTNFQVEGVVTYSESIDIDGGTIDGAVIGGTTPAAATFTTATADSFVLGDGELLYWGDGTTYIQGNGTTDTINLYAGGATRLTVSATGIDTNVDFSSGVKSASASEGVGYATGAGGTVTQATSKATAVTLDKTVGKITTHAANLNAATSVTFTFNNSTIAANDLVVVNLGGAGATIGAYTVQCEGHGSGSRSIHLRNETAGTLGEAIDIMFAVIKGVVA